MAAVKHSFLGLAPLDTQTDQLLLRALLGMRLGERLRGALSPASFKKILMLSLIVLGVYMLC